MNKQDAERLTTEYLKPIYGFALKRCAGLQDAEDLTQEIILRVYRTLLEREDIRDVQKFVWTVAHNALSNYYRDSRRAVGAPLEELAEVLGDGAPDLSDNLAERESHRRLRQEIAYLGKVQRQCVIAYYYENKRQTDIARDLGIPVGTVKWHLFEAKKDLKRGMEQMRTHSDLKFAPIRFSELSTCGSIGTMGNNRNFFRSALSENIVYMVRREPQTVNRIADALGVSPVYVESEAEFLEKYGFLIRRGREYLSNILVWEPNDDLWELQERMYRDSAVLVANALYDELQNSRLLRDSHIRHGYDENFLLWTLIPYLCTCTDGKKHTVTFEQAATPRPDGGHNICRALVTDRELPKEVWQWYGPCWNADEHMLLWQVDSPYSEKRVDEAYHQTVRRDMTLLRWWGEGEELRAEDRAWLTQQGYLDRNGSLRCVWVEGGAAHEALLALGKGIKAALAERLEALKAPYVRAVLSETPAHLQTTQQYLVETIMGTDGYFVKCCLLALLENEKLRLPTEDQKQSLTTLIVHK